MACGKQSASEYKCYSTLVQPLLDRFGKVYVSTLVNPNFCLHHTFKYSGNKQSFQVSLVAIKLPVFPCTVATGVL